MDRAAAPIDAMESENLKVTVTAVRSRAGVSIKGRKIWIAPALIEALDEFALQGGKRTRA
ncbi:hypothetical protein ACIGB6_12865 [Paeniglutamicibacter gangotriensis]|uniref:hypothetical protein n=1 Tax=Paeniglutamicibacter gangotriensis TaxID=254787 RepID=UPI0037C82726